MRTKEQIEKESEYCTHILVNFVSEAERIRAKTIQETLDWVLYEHSGPLFPDE